MDYYKDLSVSENATQEEIKKAFRKLSTDHHPDKHGGDDTRMKAISEAYATLKDPKKREEYNQEKLFEKHQANMRGGTRGFKVNNMDEFDDFGGIHSIFEQMHRNGQSPFGTRFGHGFVQKNRDVNISYKMTLNEAFYGKSIKTSFKVPSGHTRTIEVDIPAGVDTGTRIRFQGMGSQENIDTPAGDAYLNIEVIPHFQFRREAQNLYAKISVPVLTAIIGGQVDFKTIDMFLINVNIPAGTQPNSQLRIKGKGFSIRDLTARGDLFLEVNLIVPKTLTSEQLELYKKISDLS